MRGKVIEETWKTCLILGLADGPSCIGTVALRLKMVETLGAATIIEYE